MPPSDENPKSASFSSPPAKIGATKRRSDHSYLSGAISADPKSSEQLPWTLQGCVAHCFPDTNPKKLDRWVDCVLSETSVEPELLLFSALVCAVQFRITQPQIDMAIEEYRTWLTKYPQSMRDELAEIVIEASKLGMAQAIAQKGWQKGIQGSYVRKKGAPPKTRGAWVAGLIVDDLFRQAGADKHAVALAADLIAVVLGRSVDRSEFYRIRKLTPQNNFRNLAQELACEFEYWLKQNSVRANNLYSTSHGAQEYKLWRRRHRPLKALLKAFPGEQLAHLILKRIPVNLWEPLWLQD